MKGEEGMVQQSEPKAIRKLLQQYKEVFEEPNSLPPTHEVDHRIPIEPGAKPISIRPYRYPYFQKAEMERLMAKIQTTGVIRDSWSPYSSPVLSVKKKDGS